MINSGTISKYKVPADLNYFGKALVKDEVLDLDFFADVTGIKQDLFKIETAKAYDTPAKLLNAREAAIQDSSKGLQALYVREYNRLLGSGYSKREAKAKAGLIARLLYGVEKEAIDKAMPVGVMYDEHDLGSLKKYLKQ